MAYLKNQDVVLEGDLYVLGANKSAAPTKVITKEGVVTVAAVSMTDITATGNTALGNASTDTTTITGATSVTSSSANALAVGLAGATNPALQVDASTASSATGVKVKSAAAAGGVAVSVVSSGTNEALTIDAKGTGTIGIGATSTGAVTITPATTITGLATLTAGLTSPAAAVLKSGTAVPATAGAVAAGAPLTMFSSGPSFYVTSDAPTHEAVKGSICMNTAGNSTSTRLYVSDGGTTWIAVTTAS